jgi:hypothetical protein
VTWKLYRDGVLVATTADTTGAVAANGGWAFGGRDNNPSVQGPFFSGSMQDVAIYSYALSPKVIQQHYQLGLNGVYTNLPVPTLSLKESAGNVTATWSGGALVTAPLVTGPWTYLTNDDSTLISSPYTTGATNPAQFFRASP